MHEQYTEVIAPVVAQRWAEESAAGSNVQTAKDPDGPFRAKIAREVFGALTDGEKAGYALRAKAEAVEAKTRYNEELSKPPSKDPQDRQMYVFSHLQPLLRH
jgi:hypothetical protein